MHKVLISKQFWLAVVLLIFISLFFLEKTNLAASDLGRHIKNGGIIWNTGQVFHTNLYSYTHPDFYAPNHHWLFGVISYLVHQLGGFDLLTFMGTSLYTASVALIFYFSYKKAGFYPAVAATVLAIPLLADRAETRPEAFSLFFFTLFYILFAWLIRQTKTSYLWQVSLVAVALTALWVNIHIFFVLTGVLGISAAIDAYANKLHQFWLRMGTLAASLTIGVFINPLGWQMVLYPLHIFDNYGYRVSENQPLWFFLQYYTRPIHWYLAFFIILFVFLNFFYAKKHVRSSLYSLLVSGFFLLFTLRLIRMENIFAITAIPLLSNSLAVLWQKFGKKMQKAYRNNLGMMTASLTGFVILTLMVGSGLFMPFKQTTGVGLYPGYEQSIAFLQYLDFTGPIFNNFDSGSFLIYTLYPSQKVFIDNRAEAYPSDFIQSSYLAAQQDEHTWQQLEEQYDFAAIIFYRHEQTNWGQEFMVKRIQDNTWVPIYVDDYLIVFLKDTPANQASIEKFRLPKEMFSVSTN